MITKLFTEINEKMDEVEKILKDNNYFVNLEKKMKEYNDRMMAIHDNEATKYINRIDRAIEYIQNHQLVFEVSSKKQIREWFDMFYNECIGILKGSDSNE